jgi:hypothetical protein
MRTSVRAGGYRSQLFPAGRSFGEAQHFIFGERCNTVILPRFIRYLPRNVFGSWRARCAQTRVIATLHHQSAKEWVQQRLKTSSVVIGRLPTQVHAPKMNDLTRFGIHLG